MFNYVLRLLSIIILGLICNVVRAEISSQTLGLLINVNDPESVKIGEYYKRVRAIPDENIIFLNFKSGVDALSEVEFSKINNQLKAKVPDRLQAYALAWRKPWKVGCMSVTSAFTFGYDERYCSEGCVKTKATNYFNSESIEPYTDYKMRPSMLLSSDSYEGVKRLIDTGEKADYLRPNGTAYLLSTSDESRNVRSLYYPYIKSLFNALIEVELFDADAVIHKSDVLFYFTGSAKVKGIATNKFLPGAIADHLTSSGGHLFGGRQMSVLEWIKAGATASYGTVVEPCNFTQKFPNPVIVMKYYLTGSRLIEAYWKSVQMPGQGVFVGEPLASPFRECEFKLLRGRYEFIEHAVDNYVVRSARNCH